MSMLEKCKPAAGLAFFALSMYVMAQQAYHIRMYAIHTYGYVIHEFDPWFNYRATEYLAERGWHAFFHWFDYMSWYPLGRPVGTTIFPGMQITSVAIWKALPHFGTVMSLNDVCCLVPAWFGVIASFLLAMLAVECSGSYTNGAFAGLIMAILPAHIMRSVAGGYDNESVAMTAMMLTFYCWVRSLREVPSVKDGRATLGSVGFGIATGFAYIYMVATWGGYVFVVNMIGAHAAVLVGMGRYSSKLHRAYSLFYVIGTLGAIRVPPVGMMPLKSLEQMLPLAIFLGMQLLEYVEIQRRKRRLTLLQVWELRVKLAVPCVAIAAVAVAIIMPTGYFGPLSSRIRGLFLKHTRTGNPLVDSVAEHQPGSTRMYHQYLHHVFYLVPIGFVLSLFTWTDSNSFLVLYGIVAYFFASKMARLVILLGPPAASLAGVAIGTILTFCLVDAPMRMFLGAPPKEKEPEAAEPEPEPEPDKPTEIKKGKDGKPLKPSQAIKQRQKAKAAAKGPNEVDEVFALLKTSKATFLEAANSPKGLSTRIVLGVLFAALMLYRYQEFYQYAHMMAESSSRPQIMFKATLQNGQTVMVDDYREAYLWLKAKTPEDARVMAWWDYGYQITGIANRTSIADGNTWNHEHIATLGRILTAPEDEAHAYARHLADYVLVWAGGGGDDLAKSPHLARIGNSVFHGHCGTDPTCSNFGFYQDRSPTPMMAKSLLFKLVSYGRQGVAVNQSLFEHVYTSKYGKVRIFKVKRVSLKSKNWIADHANKICDAPGSWYCVGQYPPALRSFIESRHNFKQLEDFNVKKDAHSEKYHEEYMRRMAGGAARASADKDEA